MVTRLFLTPRLMSDVTEILCAIEQGNLRAAEQLLPLVYDELRKLAAAKMAQERPDQTLQATALVHEAYVRLVGLDKVQHWDSRSHFFAAAAEAMRRILIENVRRKSRHKHGGQNHRVEFVDVAARRPMNACSHSMRRSLAWRRKIRRSPGSWNCVILGA